MKYDCIVIGGGTSGLVSALTLQKKGKKVLLLEKEMNLGGIFTSFVRGRFEFDVNCFPFYGFKNQEGIGDELLKRLGIWSKISLIPSPELFVLHDKETKEEYCFPVGIEEFIAKMEEYVPESSEMMVTFFGLCEDINEALDYIEEQKGSLDEKDLKQKFPNFVELAPHKVNEVFDFLKMPKKVVQLLSAFNIYLGSSFHDLSFVYFAHFVFSFVKYGPCYPKRTSYEFSKVLESEFLENGGIVKKHSKVDEILLEGGQVVGVKVKDKEYKTNHIIADLSPRVVYGSMIKKEEVPTYCFQLENERMLGPSCIEVFLGLNRSKEELGFKHSVYLFSNSICFDKEISKLKDVFSGQFLCTVREKKNDQTILVLSSFIYKNAFDKLVSKENYLKMKEQLEDFFVTILEDEMKISIREAIEEMEIATPVTFARYTNHPEGSVFGYMAKGYDNLLPRMFHEEEENVIKGLRFCGSFGTHLSLFLDTLENAEKVALKTFGECEE